MPKLSVPGNGMQTIGYSANGEASDWMLSTYGIYAMSPELGTPNPRTSEFFIISPKDIKIMVEKNSDWIFYAFRQLLP